MYGCIEEAQQYIMNTYSRFPLILDRGEGCYVYDQAGKKYLDMCAGIAVNSLGYGHERLKEALKAQIDKLIHVSNLYYTEPQVKAAKLLVENSTFNQVFFCNSGAEANEAALKAARKYGKTKAPSKTKIISMYQSFHGRTYGAVTATGQEKYQKSFTPMVSGFEYAEYNDIESLKQIIDEDTCAVILEVIQGEGGIRVGNKAYLQQVEKLCKQYEALLIIDEVQTGIGRTGSLFAYEQFEIQPDIITLAKGLGAGVPIGAMLCNDEANVFIPGDHASTFGGNPLVTTAASVVLEELIDNNRIQHVQEIGKYLRGELLKLKEKYPMIIEVRGIGLMQGIELSGTAKEVIGECIDAGMLIVGAGEKVIRFVPPLIIEREEIDQAITILEKAIQHQI
ncbi:MAG: aspartate aminotransferase family protein [Cellulosilyticaceae bacterium]